jgi:hypothetical protein
MALPALPVSIARLPTPVVQEAGAVVSAREMDRFCRKFCVLSQDNPGWDGTRLVQAFLVDHWIEIRHHESPEILVENVFAEFLRRKDERRLVRGQSEGISPE